MNAVKIKLDGPLSNRSSVTYGSTVYFKVKVEDNYGQPANATLSWKLIGRYGNRFATGYISTAASSFDITITPSQMGETLGTRTLVCTADDGQRIITAETRIRVMQ